MRVSNSFSEGEINVLEFIINSLLQGSSPGAVLRNKDFISLCRKVHAMKQKADEAKFLAKRVEGEQGLPKVKEGQGQRASGRKKAQAS
ncbi:MAG: hypothetical protein N2515_03330 [Deltaproteobacteria bacterium]|nr:hypothetical protein [Sandaracinaceae bacterium]MCX7807618.1 hypothetical protein [Deltaproteobacteria bacterium]MDW8245798.1 hypothetical protein [Sandaracinaceae bacterium]